MRFPQVILVPLFILTASSYAFPSPDHPALRASMIRDDAQSRQLRVNHASRDAEERGFLTSAVAKTKMWWKTKRWAEKGTPADEVKKALGLDKMTESAMKENPNYKYYQKYLYKAEGVKLDGWAESSQISPPSLWSKFGLDQMSATQRANSDKLRVYTRYLKKYDNNVYRYGYKEYYPSTAAEKEVYANVWALSNRPNEYVLKRLNIDRGDNTYFNYNYKTTMTRWKSKAVIKAHDNYKYFKMFKKLRKQYLYG
ncbi:hypothetical protein PHYPSEUDO_006769 [Phytophthora pseudosyringae]|uniref:RxLR effector protein n=1 Tax=Phytophthora pseudosyringae TaxID=221518 RepID=A0A8T1VKS5_9STRA|nr:hypothetical protein PHYPSEUDO_006769 [Phytophthora pseudosyringae]